MSGNNKGPVGVIGLGIMGSAMAANLAQSGFDVIGTDILAACRDELTKAGGTAVANASEVGKRCRHIVDRAGRPQKNLAPSGTERFARCLSVPFSRATN